jgi:AraC-like DNA-binding protein
MCFECHRAFRRMVVPLGAYATRRVTIHLYRDSVAMKEGNKTDQTRHAEQYCPDWLARQIAPLRASEPMTAYPETRAGVTVSRYREYPVPVPLNGHLMCLWTQYIIGSENAYAHRVLPDGCVDIVLPNEEPPFVAGPYMECLVAHLPPGAMIIGARFHPGRAVGLLGHPASALLNQLVPLDELWNKAACAQFSWPDGKPTDAGRLAALETALLSRMSQAAPLDSVVMTSVKWLAAHPESSIELLSRRIGMSSRQLRRRFSAAVGYSPKVFPEVLRFQSLLNLATRRREQTPLAQLSAEAGYADQPHMACEVHRFSNTQPTNLLGSAQCTLCLSGLLTTQLSPQRLISARRTPSSSST